MAVEAELARAEQVVADVVLLQDMAAGRIDHEQVKQAAQVLLDHRRSELPSLSVAVAAALLGVSRTTVEAWRQEGVLIPSPGTRRHEVTIESVVRILPLVHELQRLGEIRQLRDYIWWSAQDSADYVDGRVTEALRQIRDGDVAEEFVPSDDDLRWAQRKLRTRGKLDRRDHSQQDSS
jgi:DNA-binding transcriptional MerR regulator